MPELCTDNYVKYVKIDKSYPAFSSENWIISGPLVRKRHCGSETNHMRSFLRVPVSYHHDKTKYLYM